VTQRGAPKKEIWLEISSTRRWRYWEL
jgi:hypothetical protein